MFVLWFKKLVMYQVEKLTNWIIVFVSLMDIFGDFRKLAVDWDGYSNEMSTNEHGTDEHQIWLWTA